MLFEDSKTEFWFSFNEIYNLKAPKNYSQIAMANSKLYYAIREFNTLLFLKSIAS